MTAGSETLSNADLRLEWANKHIEQFEAEIQLFHAEKGYVVSENLDMQQGDLRIRTISLSQPPEIPPQLMLIAYDAVHNMHVALDYVACALAEANGKSVSNVYFPIGSDVNNFGTPDVQRKINKLSDDGKRFIAGLKPYKGGCDLLWAIHAIETVDKHRNLVPL